MPIDSTPFEKLRARTFVWRAILTVIATVISIIILTRLLPEWFKNKPSPLQETLTVLLLYVYFFLLTFRMLSHSDLSYNRLCGLFPAWRTLGQYSLWAVPLIIISITSTYLLFFPLSFLLPGFVKSWFLDYSPTIIWTSGDKYVIANLLNVFSGVLVAPVLEEFFFRGILLTRWTIKWGAIRAVIVSSAIFALLHAGLMGAFCFACVMAVLYIQTKSLFIPTIVHIANNGIVWIIELLTMQFDNFSTPQTITGFQESWWVGLVGLIVSIPYAIYFWKRYILKTDWQIPYLSEPTDCENNTTG